MEMVNGYVFLDLTKANVYSKALKVLGTDKPVVIKDGSGSPYFVDSLTLDGTNIIITKGGKTITIANDNTITNVGDVLTIMENIVDSKGNKRFIEVDGTTTSVSGVTIDYTKLSLSGTHLMCVCAGSVANATVLTNGDLLTEFSIPKWICDKIIPIWSYKGIVIKSDSFIENSLSTQAANFILTKEDDTTLNIKMGSDVTLSSNKNFRIQFDLLIDTE